MKKYILITILLLASFLRLYKLSDFPSGFNADEAALGYNAYSLLQTGKDEHGHVWPVNLESFGDFKPAGYTYLLLSFIKLLGMNEFSVRLPSALFGIVGVFGIYLLVRKLSTEDHALISALILAISPWHLHFSRGAWEVNVATTLLIFGVWFALKNRFALCVLTLVLSMYTYQSTRIIAPLLGLFLVPKRWRYFFLTSLLLLPLIFSIFTSNAGSRLSGVGLLADSGPEQRSNELRGQHRDTSSFLTKILHNKPMEYFLRFTKNYTDHFSGEFLFINGDVIERNKIPETGLLYITDALFLVIGLFYLIRNNTLNNKIVWVWLILAPVASAITFQTPHALRAHNMIIPLTIITALGLTKLLKYRFVLFLLIIIYGYQFTRYFHQYYIHYPKAYPAAWEYGFKEVVDFAEKNKSRYDKVWVTDKYDQPYILFLFYSKFPPELFQNNHILSLRDKFNFSTVRDYDKYHFESTSWDKLRDVHPILIIAAPEDIPDVGVNIVKTINFPNGRPAFKIVSN